MMNQKKAMRLAMKIAKRESRETARKARNFKKLILEKIKITAKKGNYTLKVHTPEDYQMIALTALKNKGFEINHVMEEGKRYMVVNW